MVTYVDGVKLRRKETETPKLPKGETRPRTEGTERERERAALAHRREQGDCVKQRDRYRKRQF
jgi:hypothetical protein